MVVQVSEEQLLLLLQKRELKFRAARRVEEGEETVNLVKEAGSDGIFVKTDVADEVSVRSLVENTSQTYGRLDYAFNNAGVEQMMTPLVEQTSGKVRSDHEHKCQRCMVVYEI